MRDILLDMSIAPMPVLWVLMIGIVVWRWKRLSRALILVATSVFLISSLPATGKLLIRVLAAGAPALSDRIPEDVDMILVPAAGSFEDGAGRWWPMRGSLRRINAALRLRERSGLPITLSGGAPLPGQPPEAETLAEHLDLGRQGVRLETTARNSDETARAIAALFANRPPLRVVLVTSATHIARMSAALRHQGIVVVAALAVDAPASGQDSGWSPGDFLPGVRGLSISRSAIREYMGILWYLASGRLDLADL